MENTETYYMVCSLTESTLVEGYPGLGAVPIAMCWANGMVGAMPVFKDLETAEEYAEGKHEILRVEVQRRVRS